MKWMVLLLALGALVSCGVDGAPVPPGQDNPATII